MTNTIHNVPRKLLERVLNAGWGSETVNALDDLRDFLESASSSANHVEDVRAMVAEPVQQVSVPDVSAMARTLADRSADACNVNREDNWAIYGQGYIDDVTAMLAAAPAAPAADGWISVSERLPGEDDQVLCWCEDETVAWAEVSSHHNSFFTDMTHELLPVTHWMPLPAAPSANSAKGVV